MSTDSPKSIRDIPTPILKAMRGMCPKKGGGFTGLTITMSHYNEVPEDTGPTLTYETRKRINAELKRRNPKGAKQ